jgi:sterol desaturase/sphingolipid hydroxylase (fatty acid hydroxylase superfamily)
MLSIVFQLLGGWVYGHVLEYAVHRFLLHGPGKKRKSVFSFHFRQHHKNARKKAFKDNDYKKPFQLGNAANKELISLALLAIAHIPVVFYLPWFFGISMMSLVSYYYHHYKSHNNPKWAKTHLPWHYDHHMGKNQDSNYGVRTDFFDRLLGTRHDYSAERKARYEHLLKLKAKSRRRRDK